MAGEEEKGNTPFLKNGCQAKCGLTVKLDVEDIGCAVCRGRLTRTSAFALSFELSVLFQILHII